MRFEHVTFAEKSHFVTHNFFKILLFRLSLKGSFIFILYRNASNMRFEHVTFAEKSHFVTHNFFKILLFRLSLKGSFIFILYRNAS